MQYRLRTLLIVLAIAPPMLAIMTSIAMVALRGSRPAAVKKFWPGMMVLDVDSGEMIHIHSDGRPESGVPGLIVCLDDERPGIRRGAAGWLGAIGSPAKDALPALKKLLASDEDERVREEAREAVERIVTTTPK